MPLCMLRRRVTMREVARLAGVSVATVSSVINGTASVSPVNTQRVVDAMASLDYRPDQLARSLKLGKSFVIGMVVPDITNLFYPEVVQGVEAAAEAEGYSVILCNSNEDAARETRHLDTLLSRRVDGVLLAPSGPATGYDQMKDARCPLVFVDRIPELNRYSSISTDNVDAAWQATRHLLGLGHRRIAAIVGNTRLSPHRDRLEGFRRAFREEGVPVREEYLRVGPQEIESGYNAACQLLAMREPPTAILSTNNRMLLGVMEALADLHLPCPGRVSVVGFDEYAWTKHHTPTLTVVTQDSFGMGRQAMELLLRGMHGGGVESIVMRAELRMRESTAAVVH
jgi:LacI family transcriptional regulator